MLISVVLANDDLLHAAGASLPYLVAFELGVLSRLPAGLEVGSQAV